MPDRDILPFSSYLKIRCSITDIEHRLRKAWIAARYYNPGLAMELGQHFKSYNVPTVEEVEDWVCGTFFVHQNACARDIAEQPQSVAQPKLHWFPSRQELLLISHHFYFDARGAWHFWDLFLDLVVRPKDVNFEDEKPKLPIARDDLLGLPSYPTWESFNKAYAIISKSLKNNSILLPSLKQDVGVSSVQLSTIYPDSHGQVRITLSEEHTTAIITSCKEFGVSVTSAFYVGLALAGQSLQAEHGSHGRYALTFHHFDARPWYKQAINVRENLGIDQHAIIPFALDLEGKNYKELVTTIDKFFKTTRSGFAQDASGLDAINYLLATILSPSAPLPSAPFFSSYGKAEDCMKSHYAHPNQRHHVWLDVEDTYNAVPMTNLANGVFIWTFKDRFNVLAEFHKLHHLPSMFQRLLIDACDRMLGGLNIEHKE